MSKQLSLPGLDTEVPMFKPDDISDPDGKLLGYTLLLAIFPDSQDAQRIAWADDALSRLPNRLPDRRITPERLHISLHVVAQFRHTLPRSIIDSALAAAASIRCPPLPLVFDHALSFSHNHAFVLRCDKSSDAAIARLRASLQTALKRHGVKPDPSRTPHMTLLYSVRHVEEHSIIPISWVATRFALIVSHVGLTHHQWLAQWPLMHNR